MTGPVATAAAAALAIAAPAGAQTAPHAARAAADVVNVLNGGGRVADIFTPAFIDAVPEVQLRALAGRIAAQYGRAIRVARITAAGLNRYDLTIAYRDADVAATLTLDGDSGRIAGLVIAGATARLASLDGIVDAMRSLPGAAALSVAQLGAGGAPATLASLTPDRPLAVGSVFKLLVLAELVRAIDAGERRWTDVVPLSVRSVPSGLLQDWPAASPLTLHSLATLMISQSDNSATDTLIALLGRDRVAAMAAPLGWPPHRGNDPLLTTMEAATLKGTARGTLGDRYATLAPAARRAMLAGPVAATPRSAIDIAALATRPHRIDTIEWFAGTDAIVRTLDWFRRAASRPGGAGAVALDLLGVAPGLVRADAARFSYVGYKGGSEAGVMAMAYLLRTRAGRWYAITMAWNDPNATLAEQRMVALATRAVQLVDEADAARR